ncbi:MAG TPA: pitrilysin family protein [Bacteroidales bacterium]
MKRLTFLSLTFLLFLITGPIILAQPGKIEFNEFDLSNGLHVILHQNNSTPTIAIYVMYHVGSKNEKANRTGFAHFFEHLMFEGSKNIKRGEYDKYVQNAGGKNNASTSFDITQYFEVLPSNQLDLGLWLESERMLHLKIDSIGIETQRKVVKEERRQRFENQPYGKLVLDIFANSYKVHPYRWMPIGDAQYIDQAKYSEFMDFYKEFYVPQNAVLVVAGDIQIESAKAIVSKYFASIPKGSGEIYRPKIKEPAQTAEIRKTVYDKVQLPAVVYAYHTPAIGTDDAYAMDMLQKYLSGGKSSILYKSIVDQQQIALQTAAIPFTLEDNGLFILYGIANLGKTAEDLDKAIDTEIEKVKASEISDHDFQKIKNQIENDFYSQNSTMQGIAANLSTYYTYFKNTALINTEIDKYRKITKEDLKRVADQYLKPENRLVLYYLPESLKK